MRGFLKEQLYVHVTFEQSGKREEIGQIPNRKQDDEAQRMLCFSVHVLPHPLGATLHSRSIFPARKINVVAFPQLNQNQSFVVYLFTLDVTFISRCIICIT